MRHEIFKYNKLWHLAKYLGKSFSMENNPPKSFSSLLKRCFNVSYNFIIVTRGKLISSNFFVPAYNVKYFFKNATIYNSRDLEVTFMKSWNIRYIFCNKRFNDFLDRQMSKDKLTSLLAIKMWNFYTIWMRRPLFYI